MPSCTPNKELTLSRNTPADASQSARADQKSQGSDELSATQRISYVTILVTQFMTKLGDALSSTKVVLPAFMASIGVPAFFTGLVVPIRESGSMLPQFVLSHWLKKMPLRKRCFVLGAVLQGLALLAMAGLAGTSNGLTAGFLVIALLVCFSLSRALCSLASKDVLGRTIPKRHRGGLMGYSASLAGLITIGVALVLYLSEKAELFVWDVALPESDLANAGGISTYLLLAAAVFFLMGALLYARVPEPRSEPKKASDSDDASPFSGFTLLKDDERFRRFVIVRALMMSSALVAPFFILAAMGEGERDGLASIGLFIGAEGLAGLLSGRLWGRWSDRNSKGVLAISALLTTLLCLAGAWLFSSEYKNMLEIWFALFMVLAITHHGVRLGRKTYVVDMAEGDQRTDYVAVSNSLIGLLLLIFGALTAVLASINLSWVMLVLGVSSAAAFILNRQLPVLSD